ncbi:hypothetical protein ACN4EG_21240 [Alkalinema pantanalense CENA528]|uniref:hypothetical protein n=1 Tax=Alkalinema pantanalense TaxID=1620705 RepID=UPI003D6FF7A5
MANTVWINEAQTHELGSFCDRDSGHEFVNGNIIEAVRQETNAFERGDEVVWTDASINPDEVYQVPEDQRFNIYFAETDSQGVYTPSLYAPGR